MLLRQLATLAVAIVLLTEGGAETSFRCGMTLVARDSCCCPRTDPGNDPQIQRGGCCTVEHATADATVDARALPDDECAPPPLATVAAIVIAPPEGSVGERLLSQRPPDIPSLFEQRTSLRL